MIAPHHPSGNGQPLAARWPRGSRLVQLREREKRPYPGAHGNAHLGAVLDKDFVPVGINVGIVLDGELIVVDLDQQQDPSAVRWAQALDALPTWSQATPRQHATPEQRLEAPTGKHWLFRVPAGWRGTNTKIRSQDGQRDIGDVKSRGYIVAPGSTIVCDDGVERSYALLDGRDPAPAPPWLLDFATAARPTPAGVETVARDAVPAGEHDDFLNSLGFFLRTKHGLSEGAIRKALGSAHSWLADVDPRRPYTEADFARIARSCAKREAVTADVGPLAPENWESGEARDLDQAPTEWILRHFVPRGELVMVYGEGGCGKSSWGSWLAAQETQRGGSVVFFGVEEPFSRFLWRSVLAGADRRRLFAPTGNVSRMAFPRDADALRRAIEMSRVTLVYIDSIYSHFAAAPGLNAAERARHCLGPLAEVAQVTGCTILCVFHKRKDGDYLGSTEMKNVGRVMLEVNREVTGPMYVEVVKPHLFMPDYKLVYNGEPRKAIDPLNGRPQEERLDDGTLQTLEFVIPVRGANQRIEKAPPETVNIDEQRIPKPRVR